MKTALLQALIGSAFENCWFWEVTFSLLVEPLPSTNASPSQSHCLPPTGVDILCRGILVLACLLGRASLHGRAAGRVKGRRDVYQGKVVGAAPPICVFAPRFQFTYYYFFFKATPRPAGRGAPGYLAPGWGGGTKEAEETKKTVARGAKGGGGSGFPNGFCPQVFF